MLHLWITLSTELCRYALLMNGRKSVNATRNMMVVTLVTMPSGSSGSSSSWDSSCSPQL